MKKLQSNRLRSTLLVIHEIINQFWESIKWSESQFHWNQAFHFLRLKEEMASPSWWFLDGHNRLTNGQWMQRQSLLVAELLPRISVATVRVILPDTVTEFTASPSLAWSFTASGSIICRSYGALDGLCSYMGISWFLRFKQDRGFGISRPSPMHVSPWGLGCGRKISL